jgi:hypothetical protein
MAIPPPSAPAPTPTLSSHLMSIQSALGHQTELYKVPNTNIQFEVCLSSFLMIMLTFAQIVKKKYDRECAGVLLIKCSDVDFRIISVSSQLFGLDTDATSKLFYERQEFIPDCSLSDRESWSLTTIYENFRNSMHAHCISSFELTLSFIRFFRPH